MSREHLLGYHRTSVEHPWNTYGITRGIPLVEYASSWNPSAQLDWPLSWNMLVHRAPSINSVDPSLGTCRLMESLRSALLTLSWNMQVYGTRMERSQNNRRVTIWNNCGNRPSPAKCLKRAHVPNECLTKMARARSTWGMVWNMYGIHVEYVWNYERNMDSSALFMESLRSTWLTPLVESVSSRSPFAQL